ncbi:hypothetical protein [Nonomuraea sp. SYSU D8015]|uniref:hypothetical protein n=1 Tax=Nonomuraea sp. SYSU D8015 TaxID=2593644 RepID=UPI001660219E|nr:hypothetical protein [Nonomuraea sp. SYSU D8015]
MSIDSHLVRRLISEIDKRRATLHLPWEKVATRAGISTSHLRRIRTQQSPLSDLIKAKLERALEWEAGTIDGLLKGDMSTSGNNNQETGPHRFKDPAAQHIWQTPGVAEQHRLALIYMLQALRRADVEGAQP